MTIRDPTTAEFGVIMLTVALAITIYMGLLIDLRLIELHESQTEWIYYLDNKTKSNLNYTGTAVKAFNDQHESIWERFGEMKFP